MSIAITSLAVMSLAAAADRSASTTRCRRAGLTTIDFAAASNPSVAMEWTDGSAPTASGSTIPAGWSGLNNSTGELRWRRVGTFEGQDFDLLVTVSPEPSYYSESVAVAYTPPLDYPPAFFSEAGYACLGFGLWPSTCRSGSAVDRESATCADGTEVTMHAAEFDFRLVVSGSTTPMPPLGVTYLSFFDVDGDYDDTVADGGSLYEFVSVRRGQWIPTVSAHELYGSKSYQSGPQRLPPSFSPTAF